MVQAPIQILHVDDDQGIVDLTATYLEREDDRFEVQTATSAAEVLDKIKNRTPDCIVSDYDMPGQNGIEFLQRVREEYPELPFILFTGKGSEEVASEAISAGVTDYLQKEPGTDQYALLANRIDNAVEARRSALQLSRHEELMRLTEITANTGGWELDLETNNLRITAGASQLSGLDPDDDIRLEQAVELFHPEDRAEVQAALDRAVRTEDKVQGTWRAESVDGDQRVLDVTITPVTSNGNVTKLRGAVYDVTERHERRQELEQIETLCEHAQDALFLIDAGEDFSVEWVNLAWEKQTGLPADRVRGQSVQTVLGETTGAAAEDKYRECIERREPLQYEETWFEEGETHWMTQIAPVVVDGAVEYIAGATRNITARRERQRELRRLQQAIDDATVPMTMSDPSQDDNPLVYVNDAFEEVTGYSADEALGRNCRFLQGEDTDPGKVSAIREAINEEEPITVELRNYRKDGTMFWNRLAITPIYDDEGTLVRYLGIQEDVTERTERQRELTRKEDLMSTMEELADAGAWEYDPTSEELTVTDGMYRLFDFAPETDLALEETFELVHPDDRDRLKERFFACLETGEPYEIEVRLVLADNEQRWVAARGERVDEADPDSVLRGYLQDITEHKKREAALAQREDILREMNDIAVIVQDGVIKYVNPTGLDILDYTENESIGTPMTEFIAPEYRETVEKRHRAWMAGEGGDQPDQYNVELLAADGQRIPVEVNVCRIDHEGQPATLSILRDITERKYHEERFQAFIEHSSDVLSIVNPDGTYLYQSPSAESVLGYEAETYLGESVFEYVHPDDRSEVLETFEEAVADPEMTPTFEYRFKHKDGSWHWLESIGNNRLDDSAIEGFLVNSRDITERKERERELKRKNERLEEFASIVSHDLRSPLTVAENYLELAQETCESPNLARAAAAIDRSQSLIDDLLTLAREGDDVSEVESVELAEVAERSWQAVQTGDATLETHATQTLRADQSRLEQLLENLYRNAVEHGGDDVTVSVGAVNDGFYVADTGPGIPESDREKIFETGYSTNEEGTGFGLRIVTQIVEAHGWEIVVTESEQGGARFEVTGVEHVE